MRNNSLCVEGSGPTECHRADNEISVATTRICSTVGAGDQDGKSRGSRNYVVVAEGVVLVEAHENGSEELAGKSVKTRKNFDSYRRRRISVFLLLGTRRPRRVTRRRGRRRSNDPRDTCRKH